MFNDNNQKEDCVMMTTHEPLTFQDGLDPAKQLERFCQELREGDAFLAVEIEQSALLVQFDRGALSLAAYTPTSDTLRNNKDLLQVRLSAYAPGCKLRIHGLLTDAQIAARGKTTNKIPWTCYRNNHFVDGPKDWYVVSFVDRHGRTLEFTRFLSWERFHEYVLASQIGEWLLTGRRVLDFGDLSIRVRIKNLCDKIDLGSEIEQDVYDRNKDGTLAYAFVRVFTEFQYQTTPISLITARNLRFYETGCPDAPFRSWDNYEVHHILPKCEFKEFETDLRNLVKLPKPVHQLLHEVYDDINHGEKPGEAFRDRWLGVVPRGFVDSKHDLDLPDGFFEGICHDWFNKRTDVKTIRQKIADEISICMADGQDEFNLVMEWWNNDETETLMGKNYYVVRLDSWLPWWWTQHWATIANMCAYIYADHLHRRLA